jgi:hypothetical protein
MKNVNWSEFLSTRKRALSEKALANLEQQRARAASAASVSRIIPKSPRVARGSKRKVDNQEPPDLNAANLSTNALPTAIKNTAMNQIEQLVSNFIVSLDEIQAYIPNDLYKIAVQEVLLQRQRNRRQNSPSHPSILTLACGNTIINQNEDGIHSLVAEITQHQQATHSVEFSDSHSFSSSSSNCSLTDVEVESWVLQAQHVIASSALTFLCGGSLRLRRAFTRCGITTPKELSIWKIAPEGLHQALLKQDRFLNGTLLCNNGTLRESSRNPIQTLPGEASVISSKSASMLFSESSLNVLCLCADALLNRIEVDWLANYSYEDDEQLQEELGEDEMVRVSDERAVKAIRRSASNCDHHIQAKVASNDEEDQFLYLDDTNHPLIGVRLAIPISLPENNNNDNNNDDDDNAEGESSEDGSFETQYTWFELGTVVGYLPATEEEPIALFRAILDAASCDNPSEVISVEINGSHCYRVRDSCRNGFKARIFDQSCTETDNMCCRFEDLEEHEVKAMAQSFGTQMKNQVDCG